MSVFGLIFSDRLISLFVSGNPDVVRFGSFRLTFLFSAMIFQGVMNVNTGALQAYGKTIFQMMSNVIGVLVFRIVWMYAIYPMDRQPWLLWLCYPVSWVMTSVALYIVVAKLTSRYFKGASVQL